MATIAIHDDNNELVFASDPDDRMCAIEVPEGGGIVRFHFPEVPLLDGTYSVSVGVRSATETAIFDWKDQVTKFEVANPGRSTGRVRLLPDISFRLRGLGITGEVPVVGAASTPHPRCPAGRIHGVTVSRMDQVIPTLASRDAIGGRACSSGTCYVRRGDASDVFYGNASPDRLDEGFTRSHASANRRARGRY